MICSRCGFIKTEEEEIEMYICKKCSTIFCVNCIKEEGYTCLNRDCKGTELELISPDLNYFVFDQDFRRIKKGGFG